MSASSDDRRAHPRHPVVLQVSFAGREDALDVTEDLSAGGLFIRTDHLHPVGTRLGLRLSFLPWLTPLELEVEVVRVRKSAPGMPAGLAVCVPADRPKDREKVAKVARAAASASSSSATRRVLIAEDNPLLSQMIKDFLSSSLSRTSDVEFEFSANGKEAYERLERPPAVDLVITDFFMPVMDGLALTRAIRANARLRTMPVIMMTSNLSLGFREKALREGVSTFFARPVNPVHLVQTVKTLIHLRSS